MTVNKVQPPATRSMRRGNSYVKSEYKQVDPFDLVTKTMEDALKRYRAMDKPEIFLDKLTRLIKKFGIGMFFYEREAWAEADFDCAMGFIDPIDNNRCILADQNMVVADFWRKRTKRQTKALAEIQEAKRALSSIRPRCDIHNRTADDVHIPRSISEHWSSSNDLKPHSFNGEEKENCKIPLRDEDTNVAVVSTPPPTPTPTDTEKQKAQTQALIALNALNTAKKIMKSEGKKIEQLPEYFKDLPTVIKWTQNMWQHDQHACQASALMRFERNMHAISLFRLKYITQLLFEPGDFERCIADNDYERMSRYIRGGRRLITLTRQYGFSILLLVDNIHAYTIGKDTDEEKWKKEIDESLTEGSISDAFNLVNAEFFKPEYSWSTVPALEQVAHWLFQEEFLKYTPYP
ncbi:hypothetical protein BDA99DRAFT_511338 [Phascolomyces articulosus]|uniref:Uncharacterized protein n=1 Tax=Phascolomyces articulosus TaxID=60185 RepID=A0AAD5PD68_9FUNG|nr:hypothetical protein BDA99DRAFT_511338 [Phascolomyces articulosus]